MRVGLADFAEPTLLILGDAASLNWLADCIEMRQAINMAESPLVRLLNLGLVIVPTDDEGSLSRNRTGFEWNMSLLEAKKLAGQLRALACSESPAHAYLDPKLNSAGVQVIASQGEYSGDAVFIA